jgi:hypothetical protein
MYSKIQKLFSALRILVKKPYMINKITDNEEVHREAVMENFGLPNGLNVVSPVYFMKETTTISPLSFCDGSSTILDMALLKSLAEGKDYFEIGTWRGESASIVVSVAKSCHTFNLSKQQLATLNLPQDYIDQHFYFSEKNPAIQHLFGDSTQFDFSPFYGKMDIVFVDGDHHYAPVKKDTETAFRLLKNDESIIVWHDYGRTVSDVRFDVFRGILEGTPPEKRKHLYRVKNTLCAIYYPFEIDNRPPLACEMVEQVYEVEIRKQ